jgi:CRISPR/Cas system-associated endoribonuclease Cas2
MGKLEKRAREWKKGDVQKAMLAALGIVGLLAVTALAPNTLQLLRYIPASHYRFSRYARTAASRLVAKGQAVWTEENGKRFLRITPKGKREIAFEQAKVALETRKKKRWDERWRMVVFDIPERRRRVRGRLRLVMQEVGFVRLQDSVWVYPYDCEDFIALLKAELKIGKDVLYAIADTIEYDRAIRTHFGLPLA